MRIGARDLLEKYDDRLEVAKKLILGELGDYEQQFASDIIGPTMIAAAEAAIRLELSENPKKTLEELRKTKDHTDD